MKQFTLCSKNEKIFGVCAGLAKYFDIDVTLVRVGFILLTFLTGFTVFIYLILALVSPVEVIE